MTSTTRCLTAGCRLHREVARGPKTKLICSSNGWTAVINRDRAPLKPTHKLCTRVRFLRITLTESMKTPANTSQAEPVPASAILC